MCYPWVWTSKPQGNSNAKLKKRLRAELRACGSFPEAELYSHHQVALCLPQDVTERLYVCRGELL